MMQHLRLEEHLKFTKFMEERDREPAAGRGAFSRLARLQARARSGKWRRFEDVPTWSFYAKFPHARSRPTLGRTAAIARLREFMTFRSSVAEWFPRRLSITSIPDRVDRKIFHSQDMPHSRFMFTQDGIHDPGEEIAA